MPITLQGKWPFISTRNLSFSDHYVSKSGQPVWSDMSVSKAVKEGYKKNSWVYRAVRLIAVAGSSVPWVVSKDEEFYYEHPISMLLKKPNPSISRQTLFELVISWLQLSGNAYIIPVTTRGKTSELWPCSPDRLRPIPAKGNDEWLKGYASGSGSAVAYEPEEVIHFLFPDPSSPIIGIGPLQAASKAVDTDNEQQDWNKTIMQNKGVLEGVFSFKREFKRLEDLEDVTNRLNEKFSGKGGKRIGAVGSEATYTRIASTPAEIDYVNGRKFNREEIFTIFGVPLMLAGVMDRATYNNYTASELIFWMNTVVPLLDDLKDTLNFWFEGELNEGEQITYDISNVPAVRKARAEQVNSAKTLHEMGVPVSVINKMMKLGIPEYDGWDKSSNEESRGEQRSTGKKFECRADTPEETFDKKEKDANERKTEYEKVLKKQEERVLKALESGDAIEPVVEEDQDMYDILHRNYNEIALKYADLGIRDEVVSNAVSGYLEEEAIILKEKSMIDDATIDMIKEQVNDAVSQGLPTSSVSQALTDVGVFSPERALRIARTVTGTAASVGQYVAGRETGAQTKTWHTSGAGVRSAHSARSGETVGINDTFSIQLGSSVGPRFPGDPNISAADRVNCRCSLSFS